jgi:DNA adenine methylase
MEGDMEPTDVTAEILNAIPKPSRVIAPVQWYGGKGALAARIVPLIPPGKVYVEPYCGAASIFWHIPPREVEVLNDLHSELVTLFRVMQDRKQLDELTHRLAWTPYARAEFRRAREMEGQLGLSDVDRAWAFFVRQNQGFSGIAKTEGNWSRAFTSQRGMAVPANSWRGRLASIAVWHDRLSRVQIDSIDALQCIRYWDSPDTVFYLDPPYVHATRSKGKRSEYRHEQDDEHHRQLVELLLGIEGQAVLSGYDSPIYRPLDEAGWHVHRIETACRAATRGRGSKLRGAGAALQHAKRTEVLWIKRQEGDRSKMLF